MMYAKSLSIESVVDRGRFTWVSFKHWEFYEIVCVVSL